MECEKYTTYSDECLYSLISQVNYEFSRKGLRRLEKGLYYDGQ